MTEHPTDESTPPTPPAEEAPEATPPTARAAPACGSSDWQPVGALLGDWEARFGPLRTRAQQQRAADLAAEVERAASFRANGGQCLVCWDQGECAACARGRAVARQAADAALTRRVLATGLPPRFARNTFASYPGKLAAVTALTEFLESWDQRRNLVLLGRYGVGKTGLLASAITWLLTADAHEDVQFWSATGLFTELRAGYGDGSFRATLRRCQEAGLLVLDDVGAERPTDWVLEAVYTIIDHRYGAERPTWLSSNLTPDQLMAAVGERVWWRLREEAEVFVITGPNLREP